MAAVAVSVNLVIGCVACGRTATMLRGDFLPFSSGTLADAMSVGTHSSEVELRSRPQEDAGIGTLPSRRSGPTTSLTARLAFPLAFFAIALTVVVLFVGILKINNGTFIYTLDDPYIHLALSDQIRHGNYGLYSGTHAAPSSSILFPFLLAVASGTPLHPWFPLLINLCALFFTAEVIRRLLLHLKFGSDSFAIATQAAFLFLMAGSFNLIGVVFTGLEHSLHIATAAAIIYGLVLFLDRGKMPSWLPVAIVLCPMVRYEGLALSLGALVVLALRGRARTALATFATIAVLVGGFSAYLVRLGLAPLPSSVLSKSAVAVGLHAGPGHFLVGLIKNSDFALTSPTGMALMLIGIVAACMCARDILLPPQAWTSRSLVALVLLVTIVGQVSGGRFGWLERYEDYALLGTALICIYLGRSAIRSALAANRPDRLVVVLGSAAALLVVGAPYWDITGKVPLTSNNIYEQQLQMHRFIDGFYRGPVAINDLGLISYHNPYPVLDLGGLGSEKARLLFAAHADAAAYEGFVAANDVHLVMVYQEWFPGQIPETWQRVGTMTLSRGHISAAQDDVQFYVTDDATAAKVRDELAAFRAVLPPRVELTIY